MLFEEMEEFWKVFDCLVITYEEIFVLVGITVTISLYMKSGNLHCETGDVVDAFGGGD